MTRIIGKPQGYAASVPLKLVIREDIPYRSPEVGISAGTYEGTWNGADWGIDVLMPRWNKEDAMSLGGVHAFVSRTDTGQVVARYTYMPSEWVETTDGTFDLGAPVTQRRWIETQAIRDLMHNMEAATIYVTQVARDLLARGGSLPAGGSAGQVLTRTTTGYEWANGGTGGQEMTYTPTKKRAVTATNPRAETVPLRIFAAVETAHAQQDGGDFRVFKAGTELPCAVISSRVNANTTTYTLVWSDTLAASATATYEVRYGDPFAPERRLQVDDFYSLLNRPERTAGTAGILRVDNSTGWRTPNFDSDTYAWRLAAAGDIQMLPTPVTIAGFTADRVKHTLSNNATSPIGMEFFSGSTAGPVLLLRVAYSNYTDSVTSASNNSVTARVFRVLHDGMVWDTRTNGGATGLYNDFSIRYHNSGRWSFTWNNNTGATRSNAYANYIQDWALLVDGERILIWKTLLPALGSVTHPPAVSDPQTWINVDLLADDRVTASVAAEQAV